MVGSVTPYLERAVVVVEQAAKLKGKPIAADLVRSLGRAEGHAMQLAEEVLGHVDLFVQAHEGDSAAAGADAQRQTPAPGPTPVPCNNGGQVRFGGKPSTGEPVERPRSVSRRPVGTQTPPVT